MKYKKTAIIFGISGQDGAYLANLLIKKIQNNWNNKKFKQKI